MSNLCPDLLSLGKFGTILADPPWLFENRTGKVAPEHRRLYRYHTMTNDEILTMPVKEIALPQSHLYLWVPNALVSLGLQVMESWGFTYKTMLIWYKVRKDGGPDRRGVGFYFRNVTEVILFGIRGRLRTLQPGRRQENIIITQKREHSRKPDELYSIIEACSPPPYIELFARQHRPNWSVWGDQATPEGNDTVSEPISRDTQATESSPRKDFYQPRLINEASDRTFSANEIDTCLVSEVPDTD